MPILQAWLVCSSTRIAGLFCIVCISWHEFKSGLCSALWIYTLLYKNICSAELYIYQWNSTKIQQLRVQPYNCLQACCYKSFLRKSVSSDYVTSDLLAVSGILFSTVVLHDPWNFIWSKSKYVSMECSIGLENFNVTRQV